jgi:hypothetical protein
MIARSMFAIVLFLTPLVACGGKLAGDTDGTCMATPPQVDTGCACSSTQVCVSRPQAGGFALLGCVDLPSGCGGSATCDCVGCVCDGLGLSCGNVATESFIRGSMAVVSCM